MNKRLREVSTESTWRMGFVMIILMTMLVISACSGSDGSNQGVAQIERQPTPVGPDQSKTEDDVRSDALTDEEVSTLFVQCMRELGFNIPDPELNADGTVDLATLRQSIASDPKFVPSSGPSQLQNCLPILRSATFAQEPSPEDVIELQDNLLEFAQCLRDQGVDIPDPDFSNGSRAAMGSMFQGLNRANLQEEIRSCGNSFGRIARPGR